MCTCIVGFDVSILQRFLERKLCTFAYSCCGSAAFKERAVLSGIEAGRSEGGWSNVRMGMRNRIC